VSEHILVGHFLTRAQAARRAGVSQDELAHRPDVLHVGGTWLPEVYFAFQFSDHGIRPDLATAVRILHKQYGDIDIADWLARPNHELGLITPLHWSAMGHDPHRLTAASRAALNGAHPAR
jgi:hypothetical protein